MESAVHHRQSGKRIVLRNIDGPLVLGPLIQGELSDTENKIQAARRFYNGAVRDLNDGVQKVPDLLVARAFNFGNAEFFQAEDAGRVTPKVEMRP